MRASVPVASVMGRDPATSLQPLCPMQWLEGLPEVSFPLMLL
ncbi:unnamed protein product [Gulo gulo]|uniref:Uncharacterized protein n=1 Tax=Gulo gulo TaxID=48420 RepID=A0A9X9Q4Z6_GULGU|nr:unnamed protein product [Gulo gulo]